MLNKSVHTIAFLCVAFFSFSQTKKSPIASYKNKIVLYSDYGFTTAPIHFKSNFNFGLDKVKLKNNFNSVLGFGGCYKWFAFRFGINLPGTGRAVSRYGNTKYFSLGFDFSLKQLFFDVDLNAYQGFAYKNAYQWNDTLDKLHPNLIRSDINATSFSINTWQFWSEHFKMSAFRGKTAAYNEDEKTFYLKYLLNVYGLSSNQSILPTELSDSANSKTKSYLINSFDMGLIPGYAYVKRWKHFQIGAMGGLGFVIQGKGYHAAGVDRAFLGLAPRIDVRLNAGWNKPKHFLMLMAEFDNKSIKFNEFKYSQTYYSLRLVGGIRLDHTSKKDKKKGGK